MSDFTAIETQEEFDNAIKDRIERNTRSVTAEVEKKFEGFISPDDFTKKSSGFTKQIDELNGKLEANRTSISDLTAKNKAYEIASVKMKIAHEYNIPFEMSDRLSGESEEDIKKDAEKISKFVSGTHFSPKFKSEVPPSDSKTVAYKSMLQNLKGE